MNFLRSAKQFSKDNRKNPPDGLYYLAGNLDWPCTEKVGFRKNLSCKNQTLHFTQSISGGYQATKPKKTALALLDYSYAFAVPGGTICLSEQLAKASRLHMCSGFTIFCPTETQSADQRGQRPTATTTPGTSSRVLPAVHRIPNRCSRFRAHHHSADL